MSDGRRVDPSDSNQSNDQADYPSTWTPQIFSGLSGSRLLTVDGAVTPLGNVTPTSPSFH
jgi:hypothetical protein